MGSKNIYHIFGGNQKMKKLVQRKLMTAREVRDEYLYMDIRKLRTFLNKNISFVKIGNRYYYQRSKVEKLLNDTENSYDFRVGTY